MFADHSKIELFSLILTDCSNFFTAINGVNARCLDKATRIQMAYIRDCQKYAAISFACGPFNLSDIGAKLMGNVSIFNRFAKNQEISESEGGCSVSTKN